MRNGSKSSEGGSARLESTDSKLNISEHTNIALILHVGRKETAPWRSKPEG